MATEEEKKESAAMRTSVARIRGDAAVFFCLFFFYVRRTPAFLHARARAHVELPCSLWAVVRLQMESDCGENNEFYSTESSLKVIFSPRVDNTLICKQTNKHKIYIMY